MTFKLPFKTKEVESKFVTVTDETGNNELTIPVRPFSYKDGQWFKANAVELEDESKGEEGTIKVAEYHLRSRLDVPEEITRDELFRYEDGSPFSMYFVVAIAEEFGKQTLTVQEDLEKLGGKTEDRNQLQRGKKSTRKGIQKDG